MPFPSPLASNQHIQFLDPPKDEVEKQSRIEQITAYLQRPEINAALMQFGISMLQPRVPGQTAVGQTAQAIGEGAQAAGRVQEQELKRKQDEKKLEFEERKVKVNEGVLTLEQQKAKDSVRLKEADQLIDKENVRLKALGLSLEERKVEIDKALRERGLTNQERITLLKERELKLDEEIKRETLDVTRKKTDADIEADKAKAPVEVIVGPDGVPTFVSRQDSIGKPVHTKDKEFNSELDRKIARLQQVFMENDPNLDAARARRLATLAATGTTVPPSQAPITKPEAGPSVPAAPATPGPGASTTPTTQAPILPTSEIQEGQKIPSTPSATGLSGVIQGGINTILDAFNLGLISEGNEQAKTEMLNLRNRITTSMLEDVEGRPTELIRQELRQLSPEPNNFFVGAQRSLINLQKLKARVQTEMQRMNKDIFQKPERWKPEQIQKAQTNYSQLTTVTQDLDRLIMGYGLSTEKISQMTCGELRQIDPKILGNESAQTAAARFRALGC